MIVAVFDTNVLASAIVGVLQATGTLGRLYRAWTAGAFVLLLSEPILAELDRTLRKPYFQRVLAETEVATALAALRRDARVVPLDLPVRGIASHPEDDLVLATALNAGADYLVTGDRDLHALGSFEGIAIVTPRAFLDLLGQPSGEA